MWIKKAALKDKDKIQLGTIDVGETSIIPMMSYGK
jgi:hypothetical protein